MDVRLRELACISVWLGYNHRAGVRPLRGAVALSRPLRFSYPHAVHHVTLRCNNREFLFDDPAWTLFAEVLQEARRRFRLALYQFCLMTNHVHLLFKVGRGDTLSASMHWLGNTFSRRLITGTPYSISVPVPGPLGRHKVFPARDLCRLMSF